MKVLDGEIEEEETEREWIHMNERCSVDFRFGWNNNRPLAIKLKMCTDWSRHKFQWISLYYYFHIFHLFTVYCLWIFQEEQWMRFRWYDLKWKRPLIMEIRFKIISIKNPLNRIPQQQRYWMNSFGHSFFHFDWSAFGIPTFNPKTYVYNYSEAFCMGHHKYASLRTENE